MLRLAELLIEEANEENAKRRREAFASGKARSDESGHLAKKPPAPQRRAVSFADDVKECTAPAAARAAAAAAANHQKTASSRRSAFAAQRTTKVELTEAQRNRALMDFLNVSTVSQSSPSTSSPTASSAGSISPPSPVLLGVPPLKPPPTLVLPTTVTDVQRQMEKRAFKSPPLICEQGPSAPSSPTSPGGSRIRRPSPIIVSDEAINRINLLQGGSGFPDLSRMSLLSPGGYATSDLGSSPRSSFSVPQGHHSPLLLGPWTAIRDSRHIDDDGSGSECGEQHRKDLLSPGMMLSPAPYSPMSDYRSECDTPYSSYARSPNLSPHLPLSGLHFSFDPVRSASSLSHHPGMKQGMGSTSNLLVPLAPATRERSRSDGEMCGGGHSSSDDREEQMDTSCISVPVVSKRSGQYKKRLLQKYEQEQERRPPCKQRSTSSPPPGSATESEIDEFDMRSISRRCSRQPTVDEMGPLSTSDLTFGLQESFGQQKQIEVWMEQQMMALQELYRNPEFATRLALATAPNPQLLAPPTDHFPKGILARQTTVDGMPGPMKTATLWRRSRSESDVSCHHVGTAPHGGILATAAGPTNAGAFVCDHCGQAFALHDRLAKHIASRHRDRTPSQNDENKTHKCTMCTKSFGRSDMLTRHMRLHTGHKPYGCQLCGQVFSRSDHLSTHQRTHTGEKPYQCPICAYAASRRDMITRHMRTHLRPDGAPIELAANQIQQMSIACGLGPTTDLSTLMAALGGSIDDYGPTPPSLTSSNSSSTATLTATPSQPLLGAPTQAGTPPTVGSGAFSAFQPTGKLLSAPSMSQSHSTPNSPSLSRQSSIGGLSALQ